MTNEQFGPPVDTSVYGSDLRRVGGFGIAASAVIVLSVVTSAVDTWSDWHRYGVVQEILSGTAQDVLDEANRADDLAAITAWTAIAGHLVAGLTFLVWLWQARRNAELLCEAEHRRGRGWVIGAWICPVVNLWFPFLVVDDVHRASRPDNPRDLVALSSVAGSRLVGLWWALFLGAGITSWIEVRMARSLDSASGFHSLAVVDTISTILVAGAAVTIIMIIRQISAWQDAKVINAA